MSKGKPQKESKFLHSGDLYRVSRTHHCNKTKKKKKKEKKQHTTLKKKLIASRNGRERIW